jgi:hypothetical protein
MDCRVEQRLAEAVGRDVATTTRQPFGHLSAGALITLAEHIVEHAAHSGTPYADVARS